MNDMTLTDRKKFALAAELAEVDDDIAFGDTHGLTDKLARREIILTDLLLLGVTESGAIDLAKAHRAKHRKAETNTSSSRYSYLDTGLGSGSWIDKYKGGKGGKNGAYKPRKKCAHSHPLLTLEGVGSIQGGSCYEPQGKFDVEILLCSGASLPKVILPWETKVVRYPIVDQSVPDDAKVFDRLIDWTIEQMKAGEKVHVGCIGGHGRTGTFLSALVCKATGEKDAIRWLREHYCDKAVESRSQVDWLHQHYGIVKVEPRHLPIASKKDRKEVSGLSFTGKSGATALDSLPIQPIAGGDVWGKTHLIKQ